MSMMNLGKIDKFYISLAVVLVFMAVLVIFTFRTIFSAYNEAYEVSTGELNANLRVNKAELEGASSWFETREVVPLEVRN